MLQEFALFGITMLTDIHMLPCIWVDEIQYAAWCIGAELQTDLTYLELFN